MIKLNRLLMVKVYQALSIGDMNSADLIKTEIKSIDTQLKQKVAALGFYVPSSCESIDLFSRWFCYFNTKHLSDKKIMERDIASISGSVLDRARDFVRRVRELCFIVFDIELNEEEIKAEEEKYIFLETYGLTIPLLKLAINVAFCKFWGEIHTPSLQKEYPSIEEGVAIGRSLSIFPRRLRVQLGLLCSQRNRRSKEAQSRINSLFQGWKKGLLPCEPELLQKSLDKHRMCLTKDGSISPELDHTLRRMVRELFPEKHLKKVLNNVPEFSRNQSASSTCDYSYAKGGNVGFAIDSTYGLSGLSDMDIDVLFNQKTSFTKKFMTKENVIRIRRKIQVSILSPSLVGYATTQGKFSTPWPVYSRRPLMPADLKEIFPDVVYQKSGDCRLDFDLDLAAVPACILEPMKIRMITKPSIGLHSRMHGVQKKLWRAIRSHKSNAFPLIGETLDRDHLYKFQTGWQVGSKMCSGDYSAATDNLKSGVTQAITEELMTPLFFEKPKLYLNILNSLKGVRILQTQTVLPKWPEGSGFENYQFDLKDFDQTNGQLMGHVLSFLVLCVANYCCYWLSIEKHLGRDVNWREIDEIAPVLINGDDILFRSINDDHYSVWYNECLPLFGFEPSVGKNFYNDRFFQINSELFRIDSVMLDHEQAYRVIVKDFVKIPYVNFGLLTNRNKQDCTKDCTVQRVGLTGPGGILTDAGISTDTVIGRVMVLPKIKANLFNQDLHVESLARLEKVWLQHTRYLTEGFGLSWARKWFDQDHLGHFETEYTKLFSNKHEPMMDERAALGDQSLKLDRGEITFDHAAMHKLKLAMRTEPHQVLWSRVTGAEEPAMKIIAA